MTHWPLRSADIARFRLGLIGAPYRTDRTDPKGRLTRYQARRRLHQSTGKIPPLEIWRSPCTPTR